MNPIAGKQLVRWAIPGWSMLIIFFLFVLQDAITTNSFDGLLRILQFGSVAAGTPPSSAGSQTAPVASAGNLTTALIGTIAGVPLGYLIYQIYFYFRWNWRIFGCDLSSRGMLHTLGISRVPIFAEVECKGGDGRLQEMCAILGRREARIPLASLYPDKAWAREIDDCLTCANCETGDAHKALDHKVIWALLECIWTELTDRDGGKDQSVWYSRVSSLFDILHGLGATRLAVGFAYLLYLVYLGHGGRLVMPIFVDVHWLSSVVTAGTFVIFIHMLTQNRNETLQRIVIIWHRVLESRYDEVHLAR